MMKCLIKFWFWLCPLIFLAHGLQAQSLQQLLEQADSQNLVLQYLYKDYLAALEKAPQVSQLPDPEAGLGVFLLPVETRLGPQWVRLSATQMFPWKGTLPAKKELALIMAREKWEEVEISRLNLHYQIKQAYYQWYLLDKKEEIVSQRITLLQSLARIITGRMEVGKARLTDYQRIELQIQELGASVEILRNQKRKPVATLKRLLNTENILPTYPDALDTIAISDKIQDILLKIRTGHPEMKLLEKREAVIKQNVLVNKLENRPSFGVGLDYIAVGQRNDAQPMHNGRDILSPRVTIKLPIQKDRSHARQQELDLNLQALSLRKENLLLDFESRLETAFADLDDSRIRMQLLSAQKKTLQSILDLETVELSNNASRLSDLLDIHNQLLQKDQMLLEAEVQMHLTFSEIEKYIPLN